MATFRKRGDLQWEARVRRKGWPTQCKTFTTKADAEHWALDVESAMKNGRYISTAEAEQTTLADAFDRYQSEILPSKKSQSTLRSQIKKIKSDPIALLSLAALTSTELAKFRDRRLTEVKEATVRKDLAFVRSLINICMKEWGISMPHGNPVDQIRLPKPSRSRDRRLLPGEEVLLIAAATDYEARERETCPITAIIRFAVSVATRRGEVAGMCWEHIDFDAKELHIPETKTDEPRTIPLGPTAVVAICLSLGDDADELPISGPVWGVRADGITKAFGRVVKRARKKYEETCAEEGREPDPRIFRDLRLHDLRHEATSRLFERGANPMTAAAITGHKTLQMLKRYTHLRPDDVRHLVE